MLETYLAHDALGLSELVRSGEIRARDLLETAVSLAERVDPEIRSVVCRFDALAEDQLEALPGGPLCGVPFLLKDLNLHMAGTPLTHGSRMFRDHVSRHDSHLVERYRRAGLVIFGKTATPELGLTTTTESRLFGRTRNPWHLDHTAGGSSGGAAAAVAAGIVPAAHASDGGGSIRVPASCCGLFGLKPSRGRVSAAPDKGEGWAGLSAQHAITRSVRDSAALLDAAAGAAPGDPYAAPGLARPLLDEVARPPGRLRIAWTATAFNGSPSEASAVTAVEEAVALCEELGHELVEAAPEVDARDLRRAPRVVASAGTLLMIEERALELGREPTPNDVEPVTWNMMEAARQADPRDYPRAVETLHAIGRAVGRFFEGFDALLSPTMAAPPDRLGVLALDNPDGSEFGRALKASIGFTQLMNVAGNPAMSVPLHWSLDGLPLGVQFAAAYGREDLLFRLAGQLEEARPWAHRHPPLWPAD